MAAPRDTTLRVAFGGASSYDAESGAWIRRGTVPAAGSLVLEPVTPDGH